MVDAFIQQVCGTALRMCPAGCTNYDLCWVDRLGLVFRESLNKQTAINVSESTNNDMTQNAQVPAVRSVFPFYRCIMP